MSTSAVFDLKSLLPPFHTHSLPSNGFFEGSPKELNVRGLTVKELKHLTASGRFDKKVFDNCISSCVKESVDISKLLIQDYNYLVYLVRLYTSGEKATGSKVCDHCRKSFNFEFNVAQSAEVKTLEDILPQVVTKNLTRFKEEHGYDITVDVKPLTRADFVKIDNAIKQSVEMAARLNQPVTTYPLTELLKVHVTQISGFPIPVVKDQFLDYLNADEANLITNAFDEYEFGLKGAARVECPICHQEQDYTIPFTDLFFS